MLGRGESAKKLATFLTSWRHHHAGTATTSGKEPPRACILTGSPGTGKSSTIKAVAADLGWDVREFNASDTRSRKAIIESIAPATSSFAVSSLLAKSSSHHGNSNSTRQVTGPVVVVLEEVDGMTRNDSGGMAEITRMVSKSRVPIICTANDDYKVRSLTDKMLHLKFPKLRFESISRRFMQICELEGLTMQENTLRRLFEENNGDVRLLLNTLQVIRLGASNLSYDQAGELMSTSKKSADLSNFAVFEKIMDGGSYRQSSLRDRIALHFSDASMVPLFVQENYLSMKPTCGMNDLSTLAALDKAASSISAAENVEVIIQRTQSYSLASSHALLATLIPAHCYNGRISGRLGFPSWFGNYSKSRKYARLMNGVTAHVSRSASVGVSVFMTEASDPMKEHFLKPLIMQGKEGVSECIARLDSYEMTKDDLDCVVECGYLSPLIAGKWIDPWTLVASDVRSALTRTYNKTHAQAAPPIKISKKETEASQALLLDEDGTIIEQDQVADADNEEGEAENDVSGDALIKMVKKKKAAKSEKSKAAPKGKKGSKERA